MSKFWYFDRKGRPTSNEKAICDKINSLVSENKLTSKQIDQYTNDYGSPSNEMDLDEMFGFLTGDYFDGSKYQYSDEGYENEENFDEEEEYEDFDDEGVSSESNNSNQSKNPIDFNPFEDPVIERKYTQGFKRSNSGVDDESDAEDDTEDEDVEFSEDDLKMPKDGESVSENDEDFEEDIPEPDWASTDGSSSDGEDEEYDDDEEYDEDSDDSGKLGGDNLKDLSPAQKRKSAEKTAEALLNMYCQFVPMPFKKWSGINERKVQKLVFENKIDLTMQLENNITVKDYIDGTNEQVEEVFTVSEETREEIKDPLIDVLLEQDLALTPTQRLMLAVGGHLVTMGFSAYQLAQNNKQALETFEKFHNQLNKEKAPVYQQTKSTYTKPKKNKSNDDLQKFEKDSVEEIMKMMRDDDEEDDIIDAEHDPNVDVSEDYGDDD